MPLNISFPGKDAAGNKTNNPFAEQLDFFQRKLNLPTSRWDDIQKSAHDRAFIVAGAAHADLLNDLRAAVRRVIEEGRGLEAFRKTFNAIVKKHGWAGWTGEDTAEGRAWRARVIYRTNMSTSYAAGRWAQLNDPALLASRPYWRYVHSDAVLHPRPLHLSWHGLVLHHEHDFWLTHFPPNGWGCMCHVVAVDAKAYAKAQAEGKDTPPDGWDGIDPKTGAPVGIDKGWDYAPGANTDKLLKDFIDQKLIKLDAPVGAAMYRAMEPTLRAEQQASYGTFLDKVLADPIKRGRVAIVGAVDPATVEWLAKARSIKLASAEIAVQDSLIIGKKAVRHQLAGDALSAAEWAGLPRLLAAPEQILFDTRTGKLLYIGAAGDNRQAKLALEFNYALKKGNGPVNMIVSAFKVAAQAIATEIKGGLYLLVK